MRFIFADQSLLHFWWRESKALRKTLSLLATEKLYFGCQVGDQDKTWSHKNLQPHLEPPRDSNCKLTKPMKFSMAVIWQRPWNHLANAIIP